MHIIVKYVKIDKTNREVPRRVVLNLPREYKWVDYPQVAAECAEPGEKIVAIIEGGYH